MSIKWTVLNMGCLSRNKFWGEHPDTAYRKAYCTSTVIEAGDDIIIVDPPMAGEGMCNLLDSRCGLAIKDITKVFITHTHGDHMEGLDAFPHAQWYLSPGEMKTLEKEPRWNEKFIPAADEVAPGVRTIPLPGHTLALTGLVFNAAEGCIVVAGDGVMTKDFFQNKTGFHNSADMEQVAKTIEMLAEMADIIVPGHDNYFCPKTANFISK